MDEKQYVDLCGEVRGALLGYLQRLTGRAAIAEEVLQEALLRGHQHLAELPAAAQEARAWLFAVASRLAIDALRKHSRWRETAMDDLRVLAESNPQFLARSAAMIATPEMRNIAKEHLAACFTCVLRSFPEQKAAALLLKEVYGFSVDEVASQLEARPAQIKNWLQETRARMDASYGLRCVLVAKQGVCHQCTELAEFFQHQDGDPLAGSARNFEARINLLQTLREQGLGPWHTLLFELLEEVD